MAVNNGNGKERIEKKSFVRPRNEFAVKNRTYLASMEFFIIHIFPHFGQFDEVLESRAFFMT